LVSNGYTPYNCIEIDLTTGVPIYDYTNEPDECNALLNVANQTLVSSDHEPYLGKICQGVVDELVVPSGNLINSSYASLLPPYEAQTLVESIFEGIEDRIPCSFSEGCYKIQKRLLCSLAFFKPFPNTVDLISGSNLVSLVVYPPSMPSNWMCHELHYKCQKLISIQPKLGFNCTERVVLVNGNSKATVYRFPWENQTVAYAGSTAVSSPPNNASDAVVNTTTACPRGFSIPDDLYAPGQILITGMINFY
jgi:hypothetical protein